jgi:hypothetical protein
MMAVSVLYQLGKNIILDYFIMFVVLRLERYKNNLGGPAEGPPAEGHKPHVQQGHVSGGHVSPGHMSGGYVSPVAGGVAAEGEGLPRLQPEQAKSHAPGLSSLAGGVFFLRRCGGWVFSFFYEGVLS